MGERAEGTEMVVGTGGLRGTGGGSSFLAIDTGSDVEGTVC